MSWQLWDRLRAFFRQANLYQVDSVFQDQTSLDRITAGGQFLDLSRQHSLLQQTNLQINRLERYKDFDQMDEVGEITLALDMYADEASVKDSEQKHSIIIKARSKRIKLELEDLFHNTIMIDRQIRPIIRYICKYGDFGGEIVLTKHRDAVSNIRFMNVYNFSRIETKFGDLVGFFYQDQMAQQPTFLHPWQVMHLRLTTFENIYHPYGRSILDGARKDFKRLRLMEDAALIYRITRAPEKRIFSIPVGNIPTKDVPQYMQNIARMFKKRRFIDPATGNVNERYSPLIQEDDFFLPKRADGTGPTIDTLPGAENLDAIADIEYFKKKMISALKIPFSRVGIGDPAEPDGKSLSQVSPEFAKSIQWIQSEVAIGLKKVAIIHLALKGFPIDEIKNFDIYMTASSAIDELYRIETWSSRADIIMALKETAMFTDQWILTRFTDMTVDEVKELEREKGQIKPPAEGEEEEGPPMAFEDAVDEQDASLITEYKKMIENSIITERTIREDKAKYHSGFEYLLNEKELDSLPAPLDDGEKEPKQLLVECSVDNEIVEEVKEENRQIIIETLFDGELLPDNSAITEEDIPS